MPNELQIFTFSFSGRAKVSRKAQQQATPAAVQPSVPAAAKTDALTERIKFWRAKTSSVPAELLRQEVDGLNERADDFSLFIEEELRKLLPPFVTVQAEIRFRAGSLVIEGTVMLLSWAGAIAFAAAKEEIAKQFGDVIKIAVQRVFSRILVPTVSTLSFDPVEVNITPQSLSGAATRPEVIPAGGGQPAATAAVSQAASRLQAAGVRPWHMLTILVIVLLMFLFQIATWVSENYTLTRKQPPAPSNSPAR